MKTQITTLIFAFLISIQSFAIERDTIVINIGENKKVVVYGKTKADLQDLEKYDLNKAIRMMNKELTAFPGDTRRMIVKDYMGDTYLSGEEPETFYPMSSFFNNVHLNLSLGVVDFGVVQFDPILNQEMGVTFETFDRMSQSRYLGINLMHSKPIALAPRIGVAFEKGIGYNFIQVRGTNPFNGQTSFIPRPGQVMDAQITKQDGYYTNTIRYADGESVSYDIYPSKIRMGMLNAQFRPTFHLKDKKGKETFKLSVGAFANISLHRREVLNYVVPDSDRTKFGSLGVGFSNAFAGVSGSVGYKFIHVFMETTLFSNEKLVKASHELSEGQTTGYYSTPGRVGYSAFGVRFGK